MKVLVKKSFNFVGQLWKEYVAKNKTDLRSVELLLLFCSVIVVKLYRPITDDMDDNDARDDGEDQEEIEDGVLVPDSSDESDGED